MHSVATKKPPPLPSDLRDRYGVPIVETYPPFEPPERLLRLPAVEAMTGLHRSALFRMRHAREFPAPYRLTPKTVAWKLSEVLAWMESRPLAVSGEAAE